MSSRTSFPLFARLPRFEELSNEIILDRFLEYVQEKNLELYPAQEEAVLSLIEGQNVILNTPTGSGKSLVATALHFHSLAMGKRSIYTCPIKALVNEKFIALCKEFGPEQVGMATGDGSVNRDAPILCCTAEILANMALREGDRAKVDDVIMDEFHYYSDRERGGAWQIPLLSMPQTRFLLMSATLGEMEFFKDKLTELNGRETAVVSRAERPVPLRFEYRETPLHETVQDLVTQGSAPVYLVCFTQREAAEQAQNLMSVDFSTKEEKKTISEAMTGVSFSSPYGKEIQKFLKHGVGLHHAGLLPRYRVLVEKLAQTGLLKVICGTDTLGVGVNIPIRTVLFTKLCKYDGEKTGILSVRDFHQIAGRAGRKGFDDEGRVVCQAPEYVIENKRLEAKAKADPKKAKKIVKLKPPEKGFVNWSEDTFNRLVSGRPEALTSRFQVSHGLLLNVLSREDEDGCRAVRSLIRSSHDSDPQKKKHRKLAFTLFRSLLERGIVELTPAKGPGERKLRVNVDLQDDFSLNQSLSLYLIDTIALLDPYSETYHLDLLTLVEAILESPDAILRKQLDRVKTEKMREMKEAGMEYEERMEELEKCEHPKPLRDFVYSTFNEFSDKHPWVGTENIRPKSVAREMFETFQSFAEYVKEYELQRAEGLLLRYLSDVYRALVQTVPDAAKNDDVDAIIEYFGAIVRGVDSSLIDEWEKIRNPAFVKPVDSAGAEASAELIRRADPLSNQKAMRVKIMNEVFRFLRTLAIGDFESSVVILRDWATDGASIDAPTDSSGEVWTEDRLMALGRSYTEAGHSGLRTDPGARFSHFTRITPAETIWRIEQTLVDADEHNDWHLVFEMSVARTRSSGGQPALKLVAIEPI
jgi:superfamily II RNA helicase